MVFNTSAKVDNVFIAACILHNWILRYDGLNLRWRVDENWMTTEGDHGDDEPEAIRHRILQREAQDLSFVRVPQATEERVTAAISSRWADARNALMQHVYFLSRARLLLWLRPVGSTKRKYDMMVSSEILNSSISTTSSFTSGS
jgi:hypothetical protein